MRRPGTACHQCRTGKRRCDRPVGVTCQPCVKRELTCSSATVRREALLKPSCAHIGSEEPSVADAPTATPLYSPDALGCLTSEQIVQLLEYYIEFIHDKPHSLFHVPSLRNEVASGTITKPLLCSILGLVTRFSHEERIRALGPHLAFQAKSALQIGLEELSLQSIQSWILLGNICSADSNYASESLFFGIATKTAHIIGLAKPVADESPLSREIRSRVWWSLFMSDRWTAAALGTPRQLSSASQELPQMEYMFHGSPAGTEEWPADHEEPGLWAYMITLVEIFGPIQDLNRLLATGSLDESAVAFTVSSLSGRLERWQSDLPRDIRLNMDSLSLHQSRGQGRTFVALHLGYYHYATLLYYQYLDRSAARLPYAAVYAERCREHASAFSDLLRTSYEVGSGAMYNICGHMTVVSSSVLIHTLLLGDEGQVDAAKARLESNFKILMRLKAWWPSVDRNTQKLFAFQKACLRSVDNHTHKIDRWMVKFLLEHGNLLGEKADESWLDTPSPDTAPARSPTTQRFLERDQFTRHALSGLRATQHSA